MEPNRVPTKHVALVGVTGVGKSTVVNVLSGCHRAKVNNDAGPCTARPDPYDVVFEDEHGARYAFTLWDTRGLNEGMEHKSAGPLGRFLRFLRGLPDADEELRKFLRGKNPKINLIIFCIEAKDIRGNPHWKNYGKIYDKFCKRKITVAVVVTRMDSYTRSTDWKETCEQRVCGVVGVPPDRRSIEAVPIFEPERIEDTRDCRSKLFRLISNFS